MSHLATTEPVRKITGGPEGPTDPQVDDWLLTFNCTFKGKFGEFKKHVKLVQDNLKSQVNRIGYAGSRYAPKPLNHLKPSKMNPLNPKRKTPNPKPLNP